jgi:DNA integrity scanning protein DisA with diadenylate cyclase activity
MDTKLHQTMRKERLRRAIQDAITKAIEELGSDAARLMALEIIERVF